MMTSVSFGGAAACEWKGKAVVNARRNAMTISNFFFNAWLLSSDDLGLFSLLYRRKQMDGIVELSSCSESYLYK